MPFLNEGLEYLGGQCGQPALRRRKKTQGSNVHDSCQLGDLFVAAIAAVVVRQPELLELASYIGHNSRTHIASSK